MEFQPVAQRERVDELVLADLVLVDHLRLRVDACRRCRTACRRPACRGCWRWSAWSRSDRACARRHAARRAAPFGHGRRRSGPAAAARPSARAIRICFHNRIDCLPKPSDRSEYARRSAHAQYAETPLGKNRGRDAVFKDGSAQGSAHPGDRRRHRARQGDGRRGISSSAPSCSSAAGASRCATRPRSSSPTRPAGR